MIINEVLDEIHEEIVASHDCTSTYLSVFFEDGRAKRQDVLNITGAKLGEELLNHRNGVDQKDLREEDRDSDQELDYQELKLKIRGIALESAAEEAREAVEELTGEMGSR